MYNVSYYTLKLTIFLLIHFKSKESEVMFFKFGTNQIK